MGFNDLMYLRNIYRKFLFDFKIFVEKFDYFWKFVKEIKLGCFNLNFKDFEVFWVLICVLLESDFGFKFSIFLDWLIFIVFFCFNYILWIEDLFVCFFDI